MKLPINIPLIKNPANWFIVLLTVMIGTLALHSLMGSKPDNS